MKIAITGASGLLGSALISHLQSLGGYNLTALSRIPRTSDGVRWIVGDLSNPRDCQRLVEDADVVVHMAHEGSPLTSCGNRAREMSENLLPTLNLLDAISDTGRKPRFIFPSSGGAIYGAVTENRPFSERDLCEPLNTYGVLKLATENYLRLAAFRDELSSVILRISNAYGKPLPPERAQGLIGTTISRVKAGLPVRIIGNPNNVRDYIHLHDLCIAIERSITYPCQFEVFNIGSGCGYSVLQVIEIFEQVLEKRIDREEINYPSAKWLPSHCVLNIQKAKEEMNWKPCISLHAGISMMLAGASVK